MILHLAFSLEQFRFSLRRPTVFLFADSSERLPRELKFEVALESEIHSSGFASGVSLLPLFAGSFCSSVRTSGQLVFGL